MNKKKERTLLSFNLQCADQSRAQNLLVGEEGGF